MSKFLDLRLDAESLRSALQWWMSLLLILLCMPFLCSLLSKQTAFCQASLRGWIPDEALKGKE